MYVYKSTAESRVTNAVLRAISLATQDRAVAGGGKRPCFGMWAVVCDFSSKAECVPLSLVKANVGRLCENWKIGMRNGWSQSCDGNFLAIFAGTVLGEKPNFTGRFFEWRRPFDFSTDRL